VEVPDPLGADTADVTDVTDVTDTQCHCSLAWAALTCDIDTTGQGLGKSPSTGAA
jgi:hypothetical protein